MFSLEVRDIKTIIQCDFDGTITIDDVSFHILDRFSTEDWHPWLEKYKEGKISVGYFNTRIFSMVKEDRRTLLEFIRNYTGIRPGFAELIEFCKNSGFEFIIISNGLDFYINFILDSLGMDGRIKVIAAQTRFDPSGIKVKYLGPEGDVLMDRFKEAYTRLYIDQGYRVIYIGNGISDFPSARLAYRTFARDELADCCDKTGVTYVPFDDLNEVIQGLQDIKPELKA